MRAASSIQQIATLPPALPEARPTTLLELVGALSEITDDEQEVVATVLYMLRAGHVRLCGNFRNHPIEDFE